MGRTATTRILAVTLVATALLLGPALDAFALANRPLSWSRKSFARHGQAVEHITLRGVNGRGHATFIRFAMANAAYRKGKLTVTVKQSGAGGKVAGRQEFARDAYSAPPDALGLVAGGNSLAIKDGKLVMTFDAGGVKGTAVLTPRGPGLRLRDRGPSGWIRRDLWSPWGRLDVDLTDRKGTHVTARTTVFVVHEASTIAAHRTYDRLVRLHQLRRGVVVDYIVAPKERGHRPLGFVIVRGKGARFVGPVTSEVRSAERKDPGNGYRVPWKIAVSAARRGKQASVVIDGARQLKRKDDLAKLNFFARKAVSLLIHPYTYTMAGRWSATVSSAKTASSPASTSGGSPAVGASSATAPEAPALGGKARYTYAQAR